MENSAGLTAPQGQKTPTIDSVRSELRNAIFWMVWRRNLGEINGNSDQLKEAQQRACSFVEFGSRSGLFDQEEANTWLDCLLRGVGSVAEVMQKYGEI